jgi:imidazolonepropionase-like amidohydrolase
MMRLLVLAATMVAALGATAADAQSLRTGAAGNTWTLIHAGTLIATPGATPSKRQTLVVRNDRIERIVPGFLTVAEAGLDGTAVEVVDLGDHYVLPGLMDAHVHLARATGAFRGPQVGRGMQSEPPGRAAVNALINARLSLAAGFTALRDVGSEDQGVFAVRDAIDKGYVLGPTIVAAGPIVSVTGGHGDSGEAGASPAERARHGVCDGEDECRRQVRHHRKMGADLIKISATGGFSDQTGLDQQMTFAEMKTIVDAARLLGMKVAAHAYAADAIREAVRAGVSSIEHGYLLDDEGIRLMKANGTFLVPTLTIAEPPSIARRFMGPGEAPSVTLRNQHAAFERAYKAGVRIALGTDCGIYPHGRNADEFTEMVRLGMSTGDALRAATVEAADLLGIGADTGSLAPGKRADIIAVSDDPLARIEALRAVDFVMKSGRVAKRDGRMSEEMRFDLEHRY